MALDAARVHPVVMQFGGRMTKTQIWIEWFDKQRPEDQRTIALAAIQRLVEIDEVRFRDGDPEEPQIAECLYWESCGEDLRIPF